MVKFKFEYKNLILISCGENLQINEKHDRAEIKYVNNENKKFTIAYFSPRKDGFSLIFIGTRPLEREIDWASFKFMCRMGYFCLRSCK